MKKILHLLLLTALAISKAHAQAPDPDTTAKHFIIMASISNLHEINAGKQAAGKSTRTDVQAFGKMMATDHSQMEQKLLQLARDKGCQLPAAVTETPPMDMTLAKATGDDFDRMYIHGQAAGHRTTLVRFKTYALIGKDPDVKAFASQMLPMLKAHLEKINALDEKYKDMVAK